MLLNGIEIGLTRKYIIIVINKSIITLELVKELLCPFDTIMHLLGSLQMSPKCLKLQTNGDSVEDCAQNPFLGSIVVSRLVTFRTFLEMDIGTRICHTGVYAHILHDGCHSTNLSEELFDSVK